MHLAIVSGQSFSEMLSWHPRDVDTLHQYYRDLDPDADAKDRESELRKQWQSQ